MDIGYRNFVGQGGKNQRGKCVCIELAKGIDGYTTDMNTFKLEIGRRFLNVTSIQVLERLSSGSSRVKR